MGGVLQGYRHRTMLIVCTIIVIVRNAGVLMLDA